MFTSQRTVELKSRDLIFNEASATYKLVQVIIAAP